MPRPVKHSPDVMLDAARALILSGGPSAASARAVSAATGAPSGSIYHRFPRRDDLVAAAWLRAQDRFLAAYLGELAKPHANAGAAAAVVVLTWGAANPEEAALLLRYSLPDLLRGEVSVGLGDHAEANQDQLQAAITHFAATTNRALPDVMVAVVDLPYAVTRRVLRDRRPPTNEEVKAMRRAASLLLGPAGAQAPELPAGPT